MVSKLNIAVECNLVVPSLGPGRPGSQAKGYVMEPHRRLSPWAQVGAVVGLAEASFTVMVPTVASDPALNQTGSGLSSPVPVKNLTAGQNGRETR